MTYDSWKTRSDLDEMQLYAVVCMYCDEVCDESTVQGSTGICEDCLYCPSCEEIMGSEMCPNCGRVRE